MTGIEATSITVGLLIPGGGVVALILGSIGGISEFIWELLILKIIRNEKKKYLQKWIKTKASLDKVYSFSNKAMIDGIITDDEIVECRNILNEYENEKMKLNQKTDQIPKEDFQKLLSVLQKLK